MQDLTNLKKKTRAALCLSCGKCSTMCPLSVSEWFSAARLVALREPEREIGQYGGARSQRQALDACLTCGSCEVRCPEGVRFAEFVRGARGLLGALRESPEASRRPCPHGQMLQSAARLMAGPRAPQRDLGWVNDGLEIAEEGEVALFVGCLQLYDILFSRELGIETLEIARSAIRLLNRLGIRPVVLSDERCCGHDLLWSGEPEAFQSLAEANLAAYEARGVKHILTTCAECCRTWRSDYPEAVPGFQPRVEHFAEFLAARLEAGELEAAGGEAPVVTYQDPCRLGRHLGVVEAPRRVLEALAPVPATATDPADANVGEGRGLVEMELAGRDAVCCGTSGFIHCDANSRRLQSERLASAEATGADKLVTACPKCLIHFRCAQSEDRRRERPVADIEVEDLTVLAASLLARPEAPATAAAVTSDGAKDETGGAR